MLDGVFSVTVIGQKIPIEKPLGKVCILVAMILCIPAFLVFLVVGIPTLIVASPFAVLAYLNR
jgi:hypothetical protein